MILGVFYTEGSKNPFCALRESLNGLYQLSDILKTIIMSEQYNYPMLESIMAERKFNQTTSLNDKQSNLFFLLLHISVTCHPIGRINHQLGFCQARNVFFDIAA